MTSDQAASRQGREVRGKVKVKGGKEGKNENSNAEKWCHGQTSLNSNPPILKTDRSEAIFSKY